VNKVKFNIYLNSKKHTLSVKILMWTVLSAFTQITKKCIV